MMRSHWNFRNIYLEEDDGAGDGAPAVQEPAEQKDPAYFSQFRKENRERFKGLAQYRSLDELADMALKGMDAKEPDYSGYLKIPTKESTREELREFMSKLGVPEGPDKYTIPAEKEPNESLKSIEETLRNAAFRAGMTDSQAKAMWGVIRAVTDTAVQKWQNGEKEKVDGFDRRFSRLFEDVDPDKRDVAIKESMGHFKTFLSDSGLGKVMVENGAIYDERMVKALADYQKETRGAYISGTQKQGAGSEESRNHGYSDEFMKEFGRRGR